MRAAVAALKCGIAGVDAFVRFTEGRGLPVDRIVRVARDLEGRAPNALRELGRFLRKGVS